MIGKFKARYCVRGGFQKRLSPEPLNSYSPVVQCDTMRLMLILQCILCLQSQNIDFTNVLDQEDIPSGEPVSIEIRRYFNSDGGQFDVVLRLKKSYMFKPKQHTACIKASMNRTYLCFGR